MIIQFSSYILLIWHTTLMNFYIWIILVFHNNDSTCHSTPSYSFVTEVILPHMMPPWSIHCCVWVGATGLWELLIFCIILSFCFFFLIVSIEKMGWKGEGGKERKKGGEKIKRKGEERRGEEESKWGERTVKGWK